MLTYIRISPSGVVQLGCVFDGRCSFNLGRRVRGMAESRGMRNAKAPARFNDGASAAEVDAHVPKRKQRKLAGGTNAKRRGSPGPIEHSELPTAADGATYTVDKVLDVRPGEAYLSWKGYGASANEWIPFCDLSEKVRIRAAETCSLQYFSSFSWVTSRLQT